MREPDWNYQMFPWLQMIKANALVLALLDDQGVLQGLAAIRDAGSALSLDYLAVAPWNHNGGRINEGVGTGLLASVVQASFDRGHDGEVIGTPINASNTFYERYGFVPTGEIVYGEPLYRLPSERAKKFLEEYNPFPREAEVWP